MDPLNHAVQKIKSWSRKPDHLAIFGLLGLLFLFYPELFFIEAAPLTGDHLEQHYPWAFLLAQSLKEFKLPFWTPLIHCGFPLVAESQVGAFYIPNLLMYFCLPFQVAYSYMNLIHWFIAGWGTYLYAKQMKLDPMPAFVAAIIFTFGSAYGGAFYNMTSLKTICWFPVALYFLERYFSKRQRRFLAGMSVCIGQSIVAGYMQMAAFTWLIFGVYAALRIFLFPESPIPWLKKAGTLGALSGAAAGALVLAFPQIYLTFQLAMMSNRTGLEEGYAYLGSLSPLALTTLINPNLSLIFRGNNLYAGSFALFLVLVAFSSPDLRKSKALRIWGAMTLLAFLLSLGRWSPLYVALIKLTNFYAFRVPAKFLGFICFGLAMLSAVGFQALWQGRSTQALLKKAFHAYLAIVAVCVGLMVAGNLFLTTGRAMAMRLGEFFVMRFVYAQPGHPHSLENYLTTMRSYPDHILKYLSWNDPMNAFAAIMAIFCVLLVWVFVQKKIITEFLLGVGIFFLVMDLYAAAFVDIKFDLASYKTALAPSPVFEILAQEKNAGRLERIYGFRAPSQRLPLVPSQNMLYGIDDIGIYTPFVVKRYYETIGLFGNINDSTLAMTPAPAFACQRLPVLDFLNVSHILSAEKLTHPHLELIFTDPRADAFLYVNRSPHAGAYFISNVVAVNDWEALKTEFLKTGFNPQKTLLLERSELQKIGAEGASFSSLDHDQNSAAIRTITSGNARSTWSVTASGKGYFVLPNTMASGWRAMLDGRKVPILKAYGMFQAVYVSTAGDHRIDLEYHPFLKEGRG